MTQVKYDLFTYQFSVSTPAQLNAFEPYPSKDELMKIKNSLFKSIFDNPLSFFHRGNKLKYKVEYNDDEMIILRIANRKTVKIEREFHKEFFDSEPSSIVVIYNNSEQQIMAIESDKTSFGQSFTVQKIIQKAFERELEKLYLRIKINTKYAENQFWEIVDRYNGEIDKIKFEFEYPNLPRVNQHLSDELKEISKNINSGKTTLEFSADDNPTLTNLTSENEDLSGLVKASAEGAGPIKIKGKGVRFWESTKTKVKSVEFDEISVEIPNFALKALVREFKEFLKNE